MFKIITAVLFALNMWASSLPPKEIVQKQIGQMIIFGFDESVLPKNSAIANAITQYDLGGVILFDRFYEDKHRIKNVQSSQQLKHLTQQLKTLSPSLLISIDQEGGKVQRLKEVDGFLKTPNAKEIANLNEKQAKEAYVNLAKELKENGINTNFAPVVDLALNKDNTVIYQLGRSYSNEPQKVALYASLFIEALKQEGVLSVLKHFPGHGSSLNDSHKGFVDVTQTWSKMELEPFKLLLKNNSIDMIMTAHIFNAHLDEHYPATLSYNTNTKLLRNTLGYEGIIISDDLQMKAISEHYTLKETVTLAINSGVDILLFGNQLGKQDMNELIDTIYEQIKANKIPYERILQSNQRIRTLKENLNIL